MKGKIFDAKVLALISVTAIALFVSIGFLQGEGEPDNSNNDGVLRAAIIDQLHDEMPNLVFHQIATTFLEDAGYQVDIITTKDITVDFYKNLPQRNYDFVVVRSHATDEQGSESVVLFTGENYTEEKYVSEQLFGYVKRATPLLEIAYKMDDKEDSEWTIVNDTYRVLTFPAMPLDNTSKEYFAISPKLVDELMVGQFSQTTFILGGCDTMSNPSMAKALIKHGASNVIGWDDAIGSADNDRIMLILLENILVNNMEIDDAVDSVMSKNIIREMMPFPANLKYYSSDSI